MTREQLEHVIRAAAAITNERSFVVIGSQAVLLPLASRELDLYPAMAPDKSDLIEGAIGALSQFDETFGYYADSEKDARFGAVMMKEKMISFATLEPLIRKLNPEQPIDSIIAWARRRSEEAAA